MGYFGNDSQGTGDIKHRMWMLTAFVLIGFVALVLRLWYLQIIKGDYYRELSEHNRIRVVNIRPPRGTFYDRNGIPLAENIPNSVITFTPEDAKDDPDVRPKLAAILGISLDELDAVIREDRYRRPQQPVRVKENVSFAEVSQVEAIKDELPGVMVEHELRRYYPYGEFAAHAMGYIGGMTQEQKDAPENAELPPDFPIGQYGLEKAFDKVVRGTPGEKGVEVDVRGRPLRVIYTVPPVPGNDLVLTIDYYAQKAAEEGLGDEAGAIVAIEPGTGEVLAMVSKPGFDPNMFTLGITKENWAKLALDELHPLNNRALQGTFPPGSTFKLAMALAGLETGKVTTSTSVYCKGGWFFGNRTFKCWKHEGHGTVSMHKAIVESCDVYFYQLGDKMGIDNIAKYSNYLGLGMKTGVGIRESSGLIPSTGWKKKARKEPWYPGETISCAIGQGYVSVTPIQLARMVAAIAGHGEVYQPSLIRAQRINNGKDWMGFPPVRLWKAPVKQENLDIVLDGMRGVVWDPGGTAHVAQSDKVEIGGKTGTAQVIGLGKGTGKKYRDHAWFVAVAPLDDPKIAVCVLVEHGGHGGSAAGPIAKKVIEAYIAGADADKKDDEEAVKEGEGGEADADVHLEDADGAVDKKKPVAPAPTDKKKPAPAKPEKPEADRPVKKKQAATG